MKLEIFYFLLSLLICAFAQGCTKNENDFERNLNLVKLSQGPWFVTYKNMVTNHISLFNAHLMEMKYVILYVVNATQLEMFVECIDVTQRKRKILVVTITKADETSFSASYYYNKLMCNAYNVDESAPEEEIKFLKTNFSNDLILYSCVNGSDAFLFLTRSFNEIYGVAYATAPNLEILRNKSFDLENYIEVMSINICKRDLRERVALNCSLTQNNYCFNESAIIFPNISRNEIQADNEMRSIVKLPPFLRFSASRQKEDDSALGTILRKLTAISLITFIPKIILFADYIFEKI